jgi:hypothetical protein
MKKKENMNIFVLLKKNVCQNENEGKHEKKKLMIFWERKLKRKRRSKNE